MTLLASGCSTGDLRAFNHAMAEQNGQTVTYYDQTDTDYLDDIRITSGVRNNSAFVSLKNTSDDYCRVKITYEDGSSRIYNLDPGEGTGSMYVSLYNQEESYNSLCNPSRRVFSESL